MNKFYITGINKDSPFCKALASSGIVAQNKIDFMLEDTLYNFLYSVNDDKLTWSPGELRTLKYYDDFAIEVDCPREFMKKFIGHRIDAVKPTHTRGGLGKYITMFDEWYLVITSKVELSTAQDGKFVPIEISNKVYEIIGLNVAWIKIATGEDIEVYYNDTWRSVSSLTVEEIRSLEFFRVANSTVMIGDREIKRPIKSVPENGKIYVVSLMNTDLVMHCTRHSQCEAYLKSKIDLGIAHATHSDALAHANALLALTKI